jgi:hypothetical protein
MQGALRDSIVLFSSMFLNERCVVTLLRVLARRALLSVTATAVLFSGGAVAQAASSVSLCVPSTPNTAITSPSSAGTCASGATAVALPASSAAQQTLISILPDVNYQASGIDGKPTIQFSGANLQVVNGSGSETTLNGEGNLVIGYNPFPGTQTGSHNLLLAIGGQSDQSYGGIDVGFNNIINNASASVLGGTQNKASGIGATVTGGIGNNANGSDSWVGGGSGNQAGDQASVSGGVHNIASNAGSSISGGYRNTSAGIDSSITGGEYNFALDASSSIAGGCDNLTGGGTPPSSTCDPSGNETVAGGWSNTSKGPESSVSGGALNVSSGSHTSVSGGGNNTATDGPGGGNAWVGGGASNIASNVDAAILGGVSNRVSTNCGTFPNTGQSC